MDRFLSQLPFALLLLIPILALLLKLFYWRQFYVVHLVMSFHLAAFMLLGAALFTLVDMAFGSALVGSMLLLFPIHLTISLRTVNHTGWVKAMLIAASLLLLYLVFFLLSLLLSLTYAMLVS